MTSTPSAPTPSAQTPVHRAPRPFAAPLTGVRTSVELLLGLSFLVAVSFGGYGAAVGQVSVVAQLGALVFLVTLTCALVSWFRPADREPSER
ncbi:MULTISPECIES: hypothetical protein [unclassified Curtobacterium]|uniref:hypothetical protein n=1 Tax=unclassified Curtobacterium TaxID=257496 RepID=UPI000D8A7CB1|nr:MULTISPECIES: hypothetical protein [unclassified Curtobacterium]PYY33183.1 hypothetical protein DEI89_10925 [Curtobacterium sp. MCBD17_030]PZE38594.1 hypothetical protein DEJ31_04775 [Curtobacterium sp. MCPF17_031]